jgi:hypothetical protein
VNALEDRLRDAYRAVADTVDPATIPAPPAPTRPRAASPGWTRFVVPLAAAAAVTLVATVSTVLEGAPSRHHLRPVKNHVPAVPSPPTFTLVNLGPSVKVYNTRSGAVVATLRPPRGQKFEDVASGGAARTFLAATSLSGPACHAYFYRFELSAAGQPSALRFLRSVPGSLPTAIAAPPGGGSYAYSTVHCESAPPNGAIGISGPAGNRTWTYDQADDYTFSLAATAGGHTLALSLLPAGSGYKDMLLNTSSTARTVDGASRVLPSVPASTTLAISPGGRTLYACGPTGETEALAAYSTATGALIRVLHRWSLPVQGFNCQISADPAGRFLLAAVAPSIQHSSTLTGFDLRTGAPVTLPVHPSLILLGSQVAW